jgi:hypothetical protein
MRKITTHHRRSWWSNTDRSTEASYGRGTHMTPPVDGDNAAVSNTGREEPSASSASASSTLSAPVVFSMSSIVQCHSHTECFVLFYFLVFELTRV